MLNIMYKLPAREDVAACRITQAVVDGKAEPELTLKEVDDTSLESKSA